MAEKIIELTAQLAAAQAEVVSLKAEKTLSLSRLITSGFPQLGRQVCASAGSTSSKNEAHLSARVELHSFGVLDKLVLIPSESSIWPMYHNTKNTWATESDIQRLVYTALSDVVSTVGLATNLQLLSEVSTFSLRPDICVVRINGKPVGVCKVKKPNGAQKTSALEESVVAGQIFSYMMMLRNQYGVRHAFGILSTYEEWRVCWLPDTEKAASVTTLLDHDEDEGGADEISRVVHCTKIYHHDDVELIKILASTLMKMNNTPGSIPTTLIDSIRNRYYIQLNERTYDWIKLPADGIVLSYEPPPKQTRKYYLLQDYHGGADGRVWLACSTTGKLVVIKFGSRRGGLTEVDITTRLEQEAEYWRHCYGLTSSSVRVETLNSLPALLMPFAFHGRLTENGFRFLPPNEWTTVTSGDLIPLDDEVEEDLLLKDQLGVLTNDPMQQLRSALTTIVSKGRWHEDLAWRHLALLPVRRVDETWTLSPIFIDLTRMRTIDQHEGQHLMDSSLMALEAALDSLCDVVI